MVFLHLSVLFECTTIPPSFDFRYWVLQEEWFYRSLTEASDALEVTQKGKIVTDTEEQLKFEAVIKYEPCNEVDAVFHANTDYQYLLALIEKKANSVKLGIWEITLEKTSNEPIVL